MQEEVTQKTIALVIKAAKLDANVLKAAMKMYLNHRKQKAQRMHGKTSVKTGTPISNSMTELYTNMRYLQYGTLQKLGLGHFDSWASSFGETQTAIDIACQL